MAVSIRNARNSGEDRRWIERAYREYLDDLAVGGTGVFPALLVTGQASDDLLGPWFHDERSMPFVILRAGEPAGFALVQRTSPVREGPQGIRVCDYGAGLVEGANHVLAQGVIDTGLTTDRRIHLGEQSGRDLNEGNASLIASRGKAGHLKALERQS